MLSEGTASGAPDVQTMLGAGTIGPSITGVRSKALVQVGDFNKDGFRDLLFYEEQLQQITAMLGQSDGGYSEYGPVEMPIGQRTFLAAQLDDDNEPEFVVRNSAWGFTYSPGIDESLIEVDDPSIDYTPFGTTGDVFAPLIKAGDLDSDGKDELIFNTSDDEIYIRWSGSGSIVAVQVDGLGEQNTLYDPADFDGDGDLDILMFSEDSQHFLIVEGTGTTSIGIVREIMREYPSIANDERPAFGQIDSNPAMDMVVVDTAGQSFRSEFNFVLNSFSVQEINTGETAIPLHIAGDLDGSGEPDLIAFRLNYYPLFPARPDYFPTIIYDFATSSPSLGDHIVGQPRRSFPYTDDLSFSDFPKPMVTSFDADLDGDEDLIWYGDSGGENNSAWFMENRAGVTGVPEFGMTSHDIADGPLFVKPTDIDADGFDEYLISGSTNIRILDLQDGTLDRVFASSDAFMLAMPDLDGDGTPELVSGWTTNQSLRIFTKNSDNSYGNRILVATGDRGDFYGLEVADFNNDGFDDIAAMEIDSTVSIFLGGVGPTVTHLVDLSSTDPSGVKPAALDYDHDGWMDLAIGSDEIIGVDLLRNNGDGTFSAGPNIPIDFESRNPYWVTSSDVDLDGNMDLVVADNVSEIAVAFLDALGNAESVRIISVENPVEVVVADFNADGLPDIGVSGNDTGGFQSSAFAVPQIAPRSFGRPIALPAFGTQGVAVSDVNLDGIADLVAVSDTERMLRAYYGSPAGMSPCTADFNGDGELNFFDVSLFVQTLPDYNGDGSFNFFDVSAFLVDYQAGCP